MGSLAKLIEAEVASYDNTSWTGKLGGEDVTLVSLPLTSSDMVRITKKYPAFMSSPNLEGMVDLIILKARDKNGEKAFDLIDRPVLMRVATSKIGEIFGTLFAEQITEDTEENHEARIKK